MSRFNAALRVAAARESLVEELTPEEELMVAPIDVQESDPDVVNADFQETTDVDNTMDAIQNLTAVDEEATAVVDTLKNADEVSPLAIAVATERLNNIFSRAGMTLARSAARESDVTGKVGKLGGGNDAAEAVQSAKDVVKDDLPGPYSDATDLIKDAEANLDFIRVTANEGIKEMVTRMQVNMKNLFRWSSTYGKEARKVAEAASKMGNTTPNESARFKNRVRIAHFTDADKNPLVTAQAFGKAVAESSAAAKGLSTVVEEMNAVYQFSKSSGRLSMQNLFGSLRKTTRGPTGALSLSGPMGIYGEEVVIEGIDLGFSSDNPAEMFEALRSARIRKDEYWTVDSLPEDLGLPPMRAADVAKNANALIAMADDLYSDYNAVGHMQAQAQMNQPGSVTDGLIGLALDTAMSGKLIKYRGLTNRLTVEMADAAGTAIDLKAKGLNCLMDYYKWSLKNQEAAGTMVPAQEGLKGGVLGFLVGGFGWFLGNASMASQASILKKQILENASQLAKLQSAEAAELFKKGEISKDAYKKIDTPTAMSVVKGLTLGLSGGLYGAYKGSQLQDLYKELEEQVAELTKLYDQAEAASKKAE